MSHLKLFHRGISESLAEFQGAPFDFLCERDLQAVVFWSCRRAFTGKRIRMQGGYHNAAAYGGLSWIETVPVKCEYPNSRLFDVALIDATCLEAYDPEIWRQRNWKNDRFWDQRVRAAIEIKYIQLGDSMRTKAQGFDADVSKLMAYAHTSLDVPFLGIALLFVQSDALDCSKFCVGTPLSSRSVEPEVGIYRYIVTPSLVRRFKV